MMDNAPPFHVNKASKPQLEEPSQSASDRMVVLLVSRKPFPDYLENYTRFLKGKLLLLKAWMNIFGAVSGLLEHC